MLVVWKFYCGLIRRSKTPYETILGKTQGNTLFHIQCAYKLQQKIACAQLLKAIHYHIQLDNDYLSVPDFIFVTNTTLIIQSFHSQTVTSILMLYIMLYCLKWRIKQGNRYMACM